MRERERERERELDKEKLCSRKKIWLLFDEQEQEEATKGSNVRVFRKLRKRKGKKREERNWKEIYTVQRCIERVVCSRKTSSLEKFYPYLSKRLFEDSLSKIPSWRRWKNKIRRTLNWKLTLVSSRSRRRGSSLVRELSSSFRKRRRRW